MPYQSQTTIAFVWDFDKTLIPNYQQEPMFVDYGVEPQEFWKEVDRRESELKARGRHVQRDILPMNLILDYVKAQKFPGLSNDKLREFGSGLKFVPGMPTFMQQTKDMINGVAAYKRWGITVEHYIVSTGIKPIIEGSAIGPHVTEIWANEFGDFQAPPGATAEELRRAASGEINELIYPLDNTGKTRAVFEISKGTRKFDVDVNTKMPAENRPVPFSNMIYIADGPSDIPVFSVVRKNGGSAYGVYALTESPETNKKHFDSARSLEKQNRVDSIGEANFNPGSQSFMWLTSSMYDIANRMVAEREADLRGLGTAPAHVETPLMLNHEPQLPSGHSIN